MSKKSDALDCESIDLQFLLQVIAAIEALSGTMLITT